MAPRIDDDMHPAVQRYLREIGRKGGKSSGKEVKSIAGRIGAAKRFANVLRCACCLQPVKPQRAKALGIKTTKTDKPYDIKRRRKNHRGN